ncbi:hypothetical protein NDU88_007567 [Pleurodeles waltl]|uniref:Uncharacterized protein n=1 Tax=Pleurodeles waltl TaxID=8319 RepID=A0AAV7RRB9_PLEWA|nr:hypothetical protein NDU88_007567 [Pleurodeles waltl]
MRVFRDVKPWVDGGCERVGHLYSNGLFTTLAETGELFGVCPGWFLQYASISCTACEIWMSFPEEPDESQALKVLLDLGSHRGLISQLYAALKCDGRIDTTVAHLQWYGDLNTPLMSGEWQPTKAQVTLAQLRVTCYVKYYFSNSERGNDLSGCGVLALLSKTGQRSRRQAGRREARAYIPLPINQLTEQWLGEGQAHRLLTVHQACRAQQRSPRHRWLLCQELARAGIYGTYAAQSLISDLKSLAHALDESSDYTGLLAVIERQLEFLYDISFDVMQALALAGGACVLARRNLVLRDWKTDAAQKL